MLSGPDPPSIELHYEFPMALDPPIIETLARTRIAQRGPVMIADQSSEKAQNATASAFLYK